MIPFPAVIAKKAQGQALSAEEIACFANGAASGSVPDYQLAALLMAVFLRGMNAEETAALTSAMASSGVRLDLAGEIPGRKTLDKHSTGGVGDKTSLVVVPILAACGVAVCKMSGRGLGHTGGTLDKLEAIRGFRVNLSPAEMVTQVRDVGACLGGQTADLAPADGKLYALRDATATVASLPLIVSSILSKKLAGGAESFLFDVKCGSGALMKTEGEARELAQALVDGAARVGKGAAALLTDMEQPLGASIGNALEVEEAVQVLRGDKESLPPATERFRRLCVVLAAEGLHLAGEAQSGEEAAEKAENALEQGDAFLLFRRLVEAQGGDTSFLDGEPLPRAPVQVPFFAGDSGFVSRLQAQTLGQAVVDLGGGRARKEDKIDPSVGIFLHKTVGEAVKKGETLLTIHARTEEEAQRVLPNVGKACEVISARPSPAPLVLARILPSV